MGRTHVLRGPNIPLESGEATCRRPSGWGPGIGEGIHCCGLYGWMALAGVDAMYELELYDTDDTGVLELWEKPPSDVNSGFSRWRRRDPSRGSFIFDEAESSHTAWQRAHGGRGQSGWGAEAESTRRDEVDDECVSSSSTTCGAELSAPQDQQRADRFASPGQCNTPHTHSARKVDLGSW